MSPVIMCATSEFETKDELTSSLIKKNHLTNQQKESFRNLTKKQKILFFGFIFAIFISNIFNTLYIYRANEEYVPDAWYVFEVFTENAILYSFLLIGVALLITTLTGLNEYYVKNKWKYIAISFGLILLGPIIIISFQGKWAHFFSQWGSSGELSFDSLIDSYSYLILGIIFKAGGMYCIYLYRKNIYNKA